MRTVKTWLATIAMLLCSITANAHDFYVDGIYYNILSSEDKTVEVTFQGSHFTTVTNDYNGHVTIPDLVTYGGQTYSVVAIGRYALNGCERVTGITIPGSIKRIDTAAIGVNEAGGTDFTTVRISDLKAWCDIDFASYASNPLAYAEYFYLNDELITNLVIPDGVEEIKANAFWDFDRFTSITIPSSVKSIGEDAFSEKFTNLYLKELSAWCDIDFASYASNPLSYAENLYLNGQLVTDLVIPNDISVIKDHAFSGYSKLNSVVIGENVTSIANNAFNECNNLSSITVASGNKIYDSRENCNAVIESESNKLLLGCKNSVIPDNVTTIGKSAFDGCAGLSEINIPNSVTCIEEYAFSKSGLKSVEIPSSITQLSKNAFNSCTNLTNVCLSNGVSAITEQLFASCTNLISVNIPNSVTEIGSAAFYGCKNLETITIPNSITNIGYDAFYGCNNLKIVYNNSKLNISQGKNNYGYVAYYANSVIKPTDETIGDYVFRIIDSVPTLIAYTGNDSEITLPEDYNGENYAIAERVFRNNNKITNVIIPNSVTSIGNYAFYKCSELTSVTIGNSVTSIGDYAFCNCSGLTSVTIPNLVTSIGDSAFSSCSALTSVTIGNSVKSIGNYAFSSCSKLRVVYNYSSLSITAASSNHGYVGYYAKAIITSIDEIQGNFVFRRIIDVYTLVAYVGNEEVISLPENYNGKSYSIGPSAFEGLSIKSITIPECVTSIDSKAFYNCSKLKIVYNNSALQLTIGSTDNGYVGYYAQAIILSNDNIQCNYVFRIINNHPNLVGYLGKDTDVTLPANYYGGVYAIGANVFRNYNELKNISIPEGITNIGSSAFSSCSELSSITIPSSITSIGDSAFYNCSNLKKVENFSNLEFVRGSTNHGYITYYAESFFNAPNGSVEGDFIFGVIDGVNTLVKCKSVGSMFEDWTSTNRNNGSSSSHTYTIAAKKGDILSFDWKVSSEAGYDIFYVSLNGTNLLKTSGEQEGHYTHVFTADGEYSLMARYKKDDEDRSGGDYGKIFNIIYSGGNTVDVTLPQNYKGEDYVLGAEVFKNTNLGSIIIPEGVNCIGENAFYGCVGLNSVTIHDDVKSIEKGAFYGCNNLSSFISLSPTPPICEDDVFGDVPTSTCKLLVPTSAVEAYAMTSPWSQFTEIEALPTEMALIDGEEYDNREDEEFRVITYTRTLPNLQWNALFVPFEIPVSDLADDYDVAYINDIHSYDKDLNGEIDQMEMEVIYIKEGTLHANHPYLIRAKNNEAKSMNIVVTDATLYSSAKADRTSIACSSAYTDFEVIGTYEKMSAEELDGCYAISTSGAWSPIASGASLNPFRLYMTITNRDGSPVKVSQSAQARINIRVLGEDNAAGITETENTKVKTENFDLSGRRVERMQKGIYIVNGKKVVR